MLGTLDRHNNDKDEAIADGSCRHILANCVAADKGRGGTSSDDVGKRRGLKGRRHLGVLTVLISYPHLSG